MTQRHAPPCPRRTEVAANASGTLRRGLFSASHSTFNVQRSTFNDAHRRLRTATACPAAEAPGHMSHMSYSSYSLSPSTRPDVCGRVSVSALNVERLTLNDSKKYGFFSLLPLTTPSPRAIFNAIGCGSPRSKRQSQPSTAAYSRKTTTMQRLYFEPAGRASARRVLDHVFHPGRLSLYRTWKSGEACAKNDLCLRRSPVRSLSFHRRSGVVVTLDLAPHRKRKIGPMGLTGLICLAAGAFAALFGGAR